MKNISSKLLAFLLIINASAVFGMQKRPAEMAAESSLSKRRARRIQSAIPTPIAGQSLLERVPRDVQFSLLQQVIEPGQILQETQNIVQTIRNVMSASKSLRKLAHSEAINKNLIEKLARFRTAGDVIEAAIILRTPAAGRWLNGYMFEKLTSLSDVDATLLMEKINARLLKALRDRDTAAALFILKNIGHLLQLDKYGRGVFAEACGYRNLEIVKLCIQNGCTIHFVNGDHNRKIALMRAISSGHFAIAQELVKAGALELEGYRSSATDFILLLFGAIRDGHEAIATLLLNNSPHYYVSPGDEIDVMRMYMLFQNAIDQGFTEVVRILIAQGFTYEGGGLLFKAINHPEILQLLAQTNLEDIDQKDTQGFTALIKAVNKSNIESVRLLLEAGALVNESNIFGETALMWAAHRGSINIIRLLLTVPGIDLAAQDKAGRTALMWAEHSERESKNEIIALLKDAKEHNENNNIWRNL